MFDLIKELWSFLRERKKFWLAPIIVVLLIFGVLMLLGSNPVIAPFIYTIF